MGYAWADEPRCRAAVVVTGDDARLALEQAGTLARRVLGGAPRLRLRRARPGTRTHASPSAVASPARPFLISDSGDNPTAGGAGDLAYMLGRLLANEDLAARPGHRAAPGHHRPGRCRRLLRGGRGARVTLRVGGGVSAGTGPHAEPYELAGEVVSLQALDGCRGGDGGRAAAASRRSSPNAASPSIPWPTSANWIRCAYDLVVVKIGYLEPELYDMAADWLLALTPGGVDQDLLRLGHHRVLRPLYPFDDEGFTDPGLVPVLL